ncbi:hypothetical protein [Microbulbifer elongatus]|uniref:hypothetical protein n=1 Tax=Microbulbifer elongatus TaxID=86173 RepID=UPI001E434B06|nr:hypothetical protein [Microbulbifer elongatus]
MARAAAASLVTVVWRARGRGILAGAIAAVSNFRGLVMLGGGNTVADFGDRHFDLFVLMARLRQRFATKGKQCEQQVCAEDVGHCAG